MDKFGGEIAYLVNLGHHQHRGCLVGQVHLEMSGGIIDSSHSHA